MTDKEEDDDEDDDDEEGGGGLGGGGGGVGSRCGVGDDFDGADPNAC